jgi:hypothetical protein
MTHKARFGIIVIYLLFSMALAFVLDYLLFQTDYVIGEAMPLFGTAVFLLPVIWAGPLNSVVGIYIFGYLVSTVLTLIPLLVGWKRRLRWKSLSLLVWAAFWVLAGYGSTVLLDHGA